MPKLIVALGVVYAVCLVVVVGFALAPTTIDLEVAMTDDPAAPISGWIESRRDGREEYQDRTTPVRVRLRMSGLNGRFHSTGDQPLVLSGTVRKAGITLAMVHAHGRNVTIDGGLVTVSVAAGPQ
jgi:hypothetical protein